MLGKIDATPFKIGQLWNKVSVRLYEEGKLATSNNPGGLDPAKAEVKLDIKLESLIPKDIVRDQKEIPLKSGIQVSKRISPHSVRTSMPLIGSLPGGDPSRDCLIDYPTYRYLFQLIIMICGYLSNWYLSTLRYTPQSSRSSE